MLLLPRLHADPFLHEVPLQVPAGRVPLRDAGGGEPTPRRGAIRSSNCSTPASSTAIGTSTWSSSTPRPGRDDILIRITATNRGPEAADAAPAAHALVPEHLVVGPGARRPRLRAAGRREGLVVLEAEHETLGAAGSLSRASPTLLFTENETNSAAALRRGRVPVRYVKDGINDYVVGGRRGGGQPRARRHQGRRSLPRRPSRPARPATLRLRLTRHSADRARRSARSSTRCSGGAAGRPTSSMRGLIPAAPGADARGRHAPGLRRHALEQAVLPLRRERWLVGRPRRPAAAEGRRRGPQPRVDAPVQRRRALDARHVGVSMVRRVGPGVPLRAARPRRPRLRQDAARPDAPRVVHAPQRTDPRLRVGLRGRQPARARVGGVARVQDREAACAARPIAASSSASSTSSC